MECAGICFHYSRVDPGMILTKASPHMSNIIKEASPAYNHRLSVLPLHEKLVLPYLFARAQYCTSCYDYKYKPSIVTVHITTGYINSTIKFILRYFGLQSASLAVVAAQRLAMQMALLPLPPLRGPIGLDMSPTAQ